MKRSRSALLVAAAAAPVALGVGGAAAAQDDEPPPPIAVELLTPRSRFTDRVNARVRVRAEGSRPHVLNMDDPTHAVVARITLQPGAQFPWHMHPGPVMVTVAAGDLVLTNGDDCVDRPYPTGTSFVEPDHFVHTAGNRTAGETVLVATYFDAPATGPLAITEGFEQPDCELPVAATHGTH